MRRLKKPHWRYRTTPAATRRVIATLPTTIPTPAELVSLEGRVLPDVEHLAEVRGIHRDTFRPGKPFDQKVLALAMACNDLRHASWVGRQADLGKRKDPGADGYDGMVASLELFASKLMGGILHETLLAVAAIRSHPDCAAVLPYIVKPSHKQAWTALCRLAEADSSSDVDRALLWSIRNKLAYHYLDAKALANGYRLAFTEADPDEYNRCGWLSTGNKMREMHFFFCDAAFSEALQEFAGSEAHSFSRLNDIAGRVAFGTYVLVAAFINWRAVGLK